MCNNHVNLLIHQCTTPSGLSSYRSVRCGQHGSRSDNTSLSVPPEPEHSAVFPSEVQKHVVRPSTLAPAHMYALVWVTAGTTVNFCARPIHHLKISFEVSARCLEYLAKFCAVFFLRVLLQNFRFNLLTGVARNASFELVS